MEAVAVAEDCVELGVELARFDRAVDVVEFCECLRRDEVLSCALRSAVRERLDSKERAFNVMLAHHPATLAENSRRAEARRLERERLERIAARERRRVDIGLQRLSRRWNARQSQ